MFSHCVIFTSLTYAFRMPGGLVIDRRLGAMTAIMELKFVCHLTTMDSLQYKLTCVESGCNTRSFGRKCREGKFQLDNETLARPSG